MSITVHIKKRSCIFSIIFLSSCGGSEQGGTINTPEVIEVIPAPSTPVNNLTKNPEGDISYLKLVNRDPDCAAHIGNYQASIFDTQQSVVLESYLTISANDTHCIFVSNNIPNHDVGANTTTGKNFASQVKSNSIDYTLTIPRFPVKQDVAIYVEKIAAMITLNGILLNGVDLDMDSAFCYHPDINAPLSIGLGTRQQCGLNADWYAVPANNPSIVTLDEYTGHAFDGRYHYHGDNDGLSHLSSDETSSSNSPDVNPSGSPVIGFAPDGFPIYGHYFYDESINGLRKVKSSWTTYTEERETPSNSSITAPPISTHPRGLFVEDWYYSQGSGDLDECNGMTDVYGNYGYYYTEDYPYGPICTWAVADESFTLDSSAFDGI